MFCFQTPTGCILFISRWLELEIRVDGAKPAAFWILLDSRRVVEATWALA
jgi:hypothetical protein